MLEHGDMIRLHHLSNKMPPFPQSEFRNVEELSKLRLRPVFLMEDGGDVDAGADGRFWGDGDVQSAF